MRKNLYEQMRYYAAGKILSENNPHFISMCHWVDWYCAADELPQKTMALYALLNQIVLSNHIDMYNQYVTFKNNCLPDFTMYDDMRIIDMGSGEVIYCICPPRVGTLIGAVYGSENDFQAPLTWGPWDEIVAWFYSL